jgi:hypothetical protein
MKKISWLLGLLLWANCAFDDKVPATAQFGCTASRPSCPTDMRCNLAQGRCVDTHNTVESVTVHDMTLTPAQGNGATTFVLSFQVSAIPGAAITATATPTAGDVLSFVCGTCTAEAACQCLLSPVGRAAPADQVYTVTLQLADGFGTPEPRIVAATFRLKTQNPAPPLLGAVGGIRYHRAPWGEAPTFGAPVLQLEDVGQAIHEDGTLTVYESPDGGSPLGDFAVKVAQQTALPLPETAQERLWVDFTDIVGNRAPGGPFPIREIDWVATLGNKVAGSLSETPHACYGRPVFEPRLVQGDDPQNEQSAHSGPTGKGTTLGGAAAWRLRHHGTPELSIPYGTCSCSSTNCSSYCYYDAMPVS